MILLLQVWAYGGSLLGMWLTGRKSLGGPLMGIVGFIPWSILAVHSGLYPMVAFNAIMTALYIRALILWRRSQR